MSGYTFFENFRESTDPIIVGKNPYDNANIPSMDYGRNSARWRARLAVPFSYRTGEDKRQYGILYIPANERGKIGMYGSPKSKDIEIYGADLAGGSSLTAKGFKELFEANKDSDFRIESGMAKRANVESGAKPGTMTEQPTVRVDNVPFFQNLRNMIKTIQNGGRE